MEKDYTEIVLVLDKSGSMASVLDDTIGGFNTFLKEQKELPGKAVFTLALFDTSYSLKYNGVPIKEVYELNERTYVPGGLTALYDSTGRTIIELGSRIDKMDDDKKPEKVIFVILTDGDENASQEITHEQVSEMIKHQTEKYKWDFIFLGANQDAFKTSAGLGIHRGATMTYAPSAKGTQSAFKSVSKGMTKLRSHTISDATAYFDKDDYKDQEDEGIK